MRIICLSWGSLIWESGVLPISGDWQTGGPSLPIEFARVGEKGELATVLCPSRPVSSCRWARLDVDDIVTARYLLRQREEVDVTCVNGIGTVVVGQAPGAHFGAAAILQWAGGRKEVDAVIWTALPPRFAGTEGRLPTPIEAASYLLRLRGKQREHAEDYVPRVPAEIRTPNREALERAIAS